MNIIKKELTEDQKQRLKNYTAIKPSNEFEYTPQIFKEIYTDGNYPVFKLKSANTIDFMDNQTSSIGGYYINIVRSCLKSWTNPYNILGADFKKEFLINDKLTNEAICLFTPNLITEIALEITGKSLLSVDEELSL